MKKITLLFVLLLSILAQAQPGTIDFAFNAGGSGPDTIAYVTTRQPDGKILIAGAFKNYNGVPKNGIARLNPDGSLDMGFDPAGGMALPTEYIFCMALQSDGKIIIGGLFANVDGTPRNNIARLNADGSHDTSFNPGTGTNDEVITISVQSTGKIIVGGLFTTYNSVIKNRIVRLNSDGSIDNTFLSGTGTNSYVWTTSVLPDDRIYIGGGFSAYNNIDANHIIRVNPDGSRDNTFTALKFTNGSVLTHAVQPDGKIVIGGYFTNYGTTPVPRTRFTRINFDGTLDTSFNTGTGLNNFPLTMVCQPDGKIVVGGAFTSYNGTTANRIVRVNSDGAIDTSFLSGTGMNSILYHADFQTDGKILLASEAVTYNGDTSRPYLTKINAYAPNAIAIASLTANPPFCVAESFDVNYTAEGYYIAGNTFTAQLSDAAGSFASPVTIGSVSAIASGSISVTIPPTTPVGSGYRIRVVSSSLATTGTDNGTDLAVTAVATYYEDADNDGYGNPEVSQISCGGLLPGLSLNNTDCDDTDPNLNPGTAETLYDGIDNNCDGQLDEGNLLTTSLLGAYCGATLASIQSLIGIQTVGGHNITGYRIRLTNGDQVQVIDKNVPHFTIPQFASHAYATTYTVEIMLQRSGVWLGYYGAACTVSTPAILGEGGAAAVIPAQCGSTLAKINTLIATTSLQGVTGYRFRITNLTDPLGPNAIQTIDRAQNWFSLQMLARYNYGTTYQVEVAVKTTGDFGGFGLPCEVAAPAVPSLANCNAVIASGAATVAATSVSGATQYRFEITRASDNAQTVITKSNNYFTFNAVPTPVFSPGALYQVRVAVMTAGTWSPFGNLCAVTSPGAAAKVIPSGATEIAVTNLFKATVYPNPFTSDFSIDVTTTDKANILLKVYDMLGRMLETKEIKISGQHVEKLGSDYPSGVYNVIIHQGDVVKTLRLVKR